MSKMIVQAKDEKIAQMDKEEGPKVEKTSMTSAAIGDLFRRYFEIDQVWIWIGGFCPERVEAPDQEEMKGVSEDEQRVI